MMEPPSAERIENVDSSSVAHFGREWTAFNHENGWRGSDQLESVFRAYFAPLPHDVLTPASIAADFGAGSGRWAAFVAPKVRALYVVEPSASAMAVARHNLRDMHNVTYLEEPIGGSGSPLNKLDFAYSIGVLHCVPDPAKAMRDIRMTLRPGGYFLAYLYYALENRPLWYRRLWRASDSLRRCISHMPPRSRRLTTDLIAVSVYYPLAKIAGLIARCGFDYEHFPLNQYARKPLYVMRNDALDRFGTPRERRFTRDEIKELLVDSGFEPTSIKFSEREPYWCFSAQNPA